MDTEEQIFVKDAWIGSAARARRASIGHNGLSIYFEAKDTVLCKNDMVKLKIGERYRYFKVSGICIIRPKFENQSPKLLGYTCSETGAPRNADSTKLDLRDIRGLVTVCDDETKKKVRGWACQC